MPIVFNMYYDEGYYVAKYIGELTDDEMIGAWKDFFYSEKWYPGLNNLSDLSQASTMGITGAGVNKLAKLITSVYHEHKGGDKKAAIFVPDKVLFGMARMFTAWMGDSPIKLSIFRDKDQALRWLKEEQNDPIEQMVHNDNFYRQLPGLG